MKTEHNYAWLKQFCGDLYDKTLLPFAVKMPGYEVPWYAATNGARAVVLQYLDGPRGPKEDFGEGPNLSALLAKENIDSRMTSRQGIIDLYPQMEKVECPKCNGKGTWSCSACDGNGKKLVECQDCGHEHECVCNECKKGVVICDECNGEKTTWKESAEHWKKKVLGIWIDGRLLVPVLDSFDDHEVGACRVNVSSGLVPTQALKVSGATWTVMVCERAE